MAYMEDNSAEGIDWGHKSVLGEKKHRCTERNSELTGALPENAHIGLPSPAPDIVKCSLISGDCLYFHYGCDGQDDRGWGCGYRTLQTMAWWLCHSWCPPSPKAKCRPPPSLPEIQHALVAMGDKPASFAGSREWIGTVEASLILDYYYNVPCKVVHVRGGGIELNRAAEELHEHFQSQGSPVMMGGDRDNSSKGILGVCSRPEGQGSYLLVMDPHYYGPPLERAALQRLGLVSWKNVGSLDTSSFYNLCLPQTAKT
ncbi:ufm1-specific protease 1-like [Esox lucius]|uniref:UFSP1/2/DUB catalytic domain-containing protein n=1 Tax=Esox lucius TaxID=8010 RepID=A0AAY5L4T4_ESOLU|nr:ufm1-specific protease 1-like [Esox lucius]XP_034146403.1 ufm1-specific protease 1-like [Esox lucius]